jgi:hypothetical protein
MTRTIAAVLALGVLLPAAWAQAEKPEVKGAVGRQLSRGGVIFATSVEQAVPGIRSVVGLKKPQQAELKEIREKVFASEALQKARKTVAKDSTAPAREKQAAQKALQEGRDKVRAQVHEKVLTPEQKEIVAKIDKAYREVAAKAAPEFNKKFAAARRAGEKGGFAKVRKELMGQVGKEMNKKLDDLLDDAQKARLERARERAKTK